MCVNNGVSTLWRGQRLASAIILPASFSRLSCLCRLSRELSLWFQGGQRWWGARMYLRVPRRWLCWWFIFPPTFHAWLLVPCFMIVIIRKPNCLAVIAIVSSRTSIWTLHDYCYVGQDCATLPEKRWRKNTVKLSLLWSNMEEKQQFLCRE